MNIFAFLISHYQHYSNAHITIQSGSLHFY